MSEQVITSRMKQILEIICNISGPITINQIGKKIGVSARTILREMPGVEMWLKNNGFELIKKPGVGINVILSLEDKARFQTLLADERIEKTFTQEERVSLIISELLQKKEPVKLFCFTTILKVSEGTISHDLDKVEEWLKKYDLTLVRKPGLGVYLVGNEKAYRKAMINLLYENLDEGQIVNMIRDNLTILNKHQGNIQINTRNRLMNLVEKEMIRKIEEILHNVEDVEYMLADSSYVGLLVHLAIAVQRIKNNEKITMKKEFLEELAKSKEYEVAKKIAEEISEALEIEIPQDEIGYITMHLKGAKMRNAGYINEYNGIDGPILSNFELTKMANKMIKIAEKESGYSLMDDNELLIGLVNHLPVAMSRLKMNLNIRNPLLLKIKEMYPEIFAISRKCIEVLNKNYHMEVPEAEIGFVAMHLGAAIEKKKSSMKSDRVYRVVIACTSGIGTSKLLGSRVRKEFENIHIVDTISIVEDMDDWLLENKIELIISTVHMKQRSIPIVMVNPLLFEEDRSKIDQALKGLVTQRKAPIAVKKDIDLKQRAYDLKEYGEAVIEVLENYFLIEDVWADNIHDLIEYVASIIGDDDRDREQIKNDLMEREEHGSTFIFGKNMILLHCRTMAVDTLKFGVVRMNRDTSMMYRNPHGDQEKIQNVIVMMAPLDTSKRHLEVISEISRNLIDDDKFVDSLINDTKERVFEQTNKILNRFLNGRINKI